MRVTVKPNAKRNEILDETSDHIKVAIAAPADKNKANKELIKFLSKHFKKKVRIKSGLTNKEKIIVFD